MQPWAPESPWPAAFAASDIGRYAFLRGLVAIGLFSRVQGRAVLEQETRRRIHDAIEVAPGVRFSHLRRRLGVGVGTLTYHLSRLEAEGLVRRQRRGSRLAFYPPNMGEEEPPGLADLVRTYVLRHPEAGPAEIARALGVSRQSVHYHLRRPPAAGPNPAQVFRKP